MDLRIWLAKNHISATKLARQIEYHPRTIQMISKGVIKPGRKVGRLIEYATKGEVTMFDVINAYKPKITDQRKNAIESPTINQNNNKLGV